MEGGRLPREPEEGSFGVDDALGIASRVHAAQVDKSGRPYIEHVRRVADAVADEGPDAVMAGLLHDVVEDGDLTLADLRAAGVPANVITAVDALTKRPGEPYLEAVARASANPLARVVKLADNTDNADETRLSQLDAATAARLRRKYQQARVVLLERPDAQ
ncbi:MAG: HD domain-containing protein [Actinomycetota bacterium]|nr:HD domain-containing protein [Actinomycetota bacterium]